MVEQSSEQRHEEGNGVQHQPELSSINLSSAIDTESDNNTIEGEYTETKSGNNESRQNVEQKPNSHTLLGVDEDKNVIIRTRSGRLVKYTPTEYVTQFAGMDQVVANNPDTAESIGRMSHAMIATDVLEAKGANEILLQIESMAQRLEPRFDHLAFEEKLKVLSIVREALTENVIGIQRMQSEVMQHNAVQHMLQLFLKKFDDKDSFNSLPKDTQNQLINFAQGITSLAVAKVASSMGEESIMSGSALYARAQEKFAEAQEAKDRAKNETNRLKDVIKNESSMLALQRKQQKKLYNLETKNIKDQFKLVLEHEQGEKELERREKAWEIRGEFIFGAAADKLAELTGRTTKGIKNFFVGENEGILSSLGREIGKTYHNFTDSVSSREVAGGATGGAIGIYVGVKASYLLLTSTLGLETIPVLSNITLYGLTGVSTLAGLAGGGVLARNLPGWVRQGKHGIRNIFTRGNKIEQRTGGRVTIHPDRKDSTNSPSRPPLRNSKPEVSDPDVGDDVDLSGFGL